MTDTPRRVLALIEHLPPDSPLARAVGPEWWWQADLHAQLLAELLDAVNRSTTASAVAALALGAKPRSVTEAIGGTPRWRRPYEPPPPKRTLAEKARGLIAAIGR